MAHPLFHTILCSRFLQCCLRVCRYKWVYGIVIISTTGTRCRLQNSRPTFCPPLFFPTHLSSHRC
ncbi:unnamed protein product [Protopolystoma xenopodis]|uniref:Uncharacterized protein n=1 Tax=Protopolystoma xenopodis TaxID=117903 RepID=A0A448X5Y4_9PLAT|nr:unnamed protein product [Protopolystoma xenopodis]